MPPPGFILKTHPRGYLKKTSTFDISIDDNRIGCLLKKGKVMKLQQAYRFKNDPNTVWVPTMDSFNCGVIQACYIMQHRVSNPTHKLSDKLIVTHDDRVFLEPQRDAHINEEYCFDYNMVSRTRVKSQRNQFVNR